MPVRKLALRRETLTDLSSGDLRAVAGASHTCTTTGLTERESCVERCELPTNVLRVCLSLDGQLCSDTCTL